MRAIVAVAVAAALAMVTIGHNRDESADESVQYPIVAELEPATTIVAPAGSLHDESGGRPELLSTRTEPNIFNIITGQHFPDVEVPAWSDEMESVILSHIAQQPSLALTDLQVQCANQGCVVFMGGVRVPVYDMSFDGFAAEHGFHEALIGGDSSRARTVFLRRRVASE